jgi:hypothetical protein
MPMATVACFCGILTANGEDNTTQTPFEHLRAELQRPWTRLHTTLTSNFNVPVGCRSDHVHPGKSQQSNANNGTGSNQKGQSKEHSGQEHVVEVKERKVVAYTFHEESWGTFNVEGSLFADSKYDRRGSQVLTAEHLLGGRSKVVLGALGNLGVDIGNGSASTAGLPLLLAIISLSIH